jgi:NADH dehydrogenase/NADH:ubiquinone oxidoreductase subunit G
MVQKTKKILFSPGNSREDWKILNALTEVFDFSSFKITNSIDLISCVSRISPFILYKRKIPSSFIVGNLDSLMYFHNSSSKSINNNYYISDSITRNSKIMSLCSIKFKNKFFNFF